MRGLAAWAAAMLAGVALGVGSAWAALGIGGAGLQERLGDWSYSRAAGSTTADPYTRAIVAREGLLALSRREALYYTLDRDADGRRLSEGCIYELSGMQPQARWWSVTLYASDDFLARNNDHAESVDASSLTVSTLWRVRVAPVKGDATHWLSSRGAGRNFSLMLRIYNPDDGWRPSAETMPTLSRLSCGDRR